MTKLLPPALEASLNAADLRPFEAPYRMQMGLAALRPEDWLQVDADHVEELTEKARLLAERRDEIVGALPEAQPVLPEAARMIAAHLAVRFPLLYALDGAVLRHALTGGAADADDFAAVAALCQEDLCLLQSDAPGAPYRLTAAALSFPSRWRLHEKLGKPLSGIHGVVPGLNDRMGAAVDRFFALLAVGRPVVRANWTIIDDPALFQPRRVSPPGPNASITAGNAGETVHFRVERQCITRLPESGAVLFTIRTYTRPLGVMIGSRAEAAALAEALRALPQEMRDYKSMESCLGPALDWLDRR